MLGQMRAELDRAAQLADEGAVVLAELNAMAGETARRMATLMQLP